MQTKWWINVRDKPGTLWALLSFFNDRGTVSLEGDLREINQKSDLTGATTEETHLLRRQTASPLREFLTVPITTKNIELLKKLLSGPDIFSSGGLIEHVQIATLEELVFVAGDFFHKECVSASSLVAEATLEHLKCSGLIRSYISVSA